MKIKSLFALVCTLFILTACGKISFNSDNNADLSASENDDSYFSHVFVFASDYASGGQIYTGALTDNITSLANANMTQLGTDALIKYQGGQLYILHKGYSFVSSDNLQIVNPWNNFETVAQFSTGNGTNPHDVIIQGTEAFISLYNPKADAANIDTKGSPGDVIVLDTQTGNITQRYAFASYLNADGDLNANADKMILVGHVLYVCLQDLDANTFAASTHGLVGMIDLETHQILGVISLQGSNPSGLTANTDNTKLFVSTTGDCSWGCSASSEIGGIETIDLESLTSENFITSKQLGGYVERLVSTQDSVFAVVSNANWIDWTFESKIVSFPQTFTSIEDVADFTSFDTDIRDIALDTQYLWVSTRVISTTEGDSSPVIRILDTATGEQIGEDLFPTVAGISIAVVD